MAEEKPWASKVCHRTLGGAASSCLGPLCTLWYERTAQQSDGTSKMFGVCADLAMTWDANQTSIMLMQMVLMMKAKAQEVHVPIDLRTIKGGKH